MVLDAGTVLTKDDGTVITDEDGVVMTADGESDCDACCYVKFTRCSCNPEAGDLYALESEVAAGSLAGEKVRIEGNCYTVGTSAVALPEGGTTVSLEGVTPAEDCDECCGVCQCLYCWFVVFNCLTKTWGTPFFDSVQKYGAGCPGSACLGGGGSGPVPGPNGEAWNLYTCDVPASTLTFICARVGTTVDVDEECPAEDPNDPPEAPTGIDPTDPLGAYYQTCLDGVIPPCGQLGA